MVKFTTFFPTLTSESLSPLSASLTSTDQIISSSVAILSGSASDARNELVGALPTGLSGSASDARNLAALQVSGSFTNLSGSSSDERNTIVTKISGSSVLPISNLSASLTSTDQIISSSVATLSGSASDARNLAALQVSGSSTALSGSASDARNLAALQVSGSFTNLSASLTTTDQTISSSVATLSGSASDSRNQLNANLIAVSNFLIQSLTENQAKVSGSSVLPISNLSASLTTTNQTISSSVATLSGSASDARNVLAGDISTNTTKVTFPGFGTSSTTALVGNTTLLQVGGLVTDAKAGNTTTISPTQAQAIIDNSAKDTNVSTNLGITGTTGARTITSSDGTDAIIPIATTSVGGVMSTTIFDEHVVNNGKTTNQNHTGEVTGATGLTITNSAVTTVKIIDGAVTHAKLEDRYTAINNISTTTSTLNLDAGSFAIFNITANLQNPQTLNIQNMKTGQVIDILATGVTTLTLTSDDTSEIFNNLGAVTYDGASNNSLQIICVDDTDSAAIYNYTISTYTADNTPN